MGIIRNELAFEREFTQIPNDWLRDKRLSRRARGLLAEITSHRPGWHVTIASLLQVGPEGRDAIRSAIQELVDVGYLTRIQTHGAGGRFNEIDYALTAPPTTGVGKSTAVGNSDNGGFADVGSADVGKSDTKKTRDQEDQLEEPPLFCPKHPHGGPQCAQCGDARRIHDSWARQMKSQPQPSLPRITRPPVCEHERPLGECEYCDHDTEAAA